ncbi:hypothetical protein DFH29DRAFT_876571 [Suillus ampliporus]|nr:hypothetical protein DFH29DRAFT_876571 [Suillus ampliporus]
MAQYKVEKPQSESALDEVVPPFVHAANVELDPCNIPVDAVLLHIISGGSVPHGYGTDDSGNLLACNKAESYEQELTASATEVVSTELGSIAMPWGITEASWWHHGIMIELTAQIKEHLAGNPDCASQPSFNFKPTTGFATRTSCNLQFIRKKLICSSTCTKHILQLPISVLYEQTNASRPWAEGRNILDYDGWAGSDIIPNGGKWAHVGNM